MKTLLPLLLSLLVVGWGSVCLAQQGQEQNGKARVQVLVSGPEGIEGEVNSFLKRELRSLGDVMIVDEKPDWKISVVMIEPKLEGSSEKIGYTASVTIELHFNIVLEEPFFSNLRKHGDLTPQQETYLRSIKVPASTIMDHWLRGTSPEKLRKLCEGIIADFDNEHLEGWRKL